MAFRAVHPGRHSPSAGLLPVRAMARPEWLILVWGAVLVLTVLIVAAVASR